MRVDSRGRVRFGHKGYRIDITVRGIHVYSRSGRNNEFAMYFAVPVWLLDEEFSRKMTEAYRTLRA